MRIATGLVVALALLVVGVVAGYQASERGLLRPEPTATPTIPGTPSPTPIKEGWYRMKDGLACRTVDDLEKAIGFSRVQDNTAFRQMFTEQRCMLFSAAPYYITVGPGTLVHVRGIGDTEPSITFGGYVDWSRPDVPPGME